MSRYFKSQVLLALCIPLVLALGAVLIHVQDLPSGLTFRELTMMAAFMLLFPLGVWLLGKWEAARPPRITNDAVIIRRARRKSFWEPEARFERKDR